MVQKVRYSQRSFIPHTISSDMEQNDPGEDHGDYTNPKESGLRSGKGNGFFRRLVLGDE